MGEIISEIKSSEFFFSSSDLNGLKEAGVYYEIESIGYHIISNADDPVFDK